MATMQAVPCRTMRTSQPGRTPISCSRETTSGFPSTVGQSWPSSRLEAAAAESHVAKRHSSGESSRCRSRWSAKPSSATPTVEIESQCRWVHAIIQRRAGTATLSAEARPLNHSQLPRNHRPASLSVISLPYCNSCPSLRLPAKRRGLTGFSYPPILARLARLSFFLSFPHEK